MISVTSLLVSCWCFYWSWTLEQSQFGVSTFFLGNKFSCSFFYLIFLTPNSMSTYLFDVSASDLSVVIVKARQQGFQGKGLSRNMKLIQSSYKYLYAAPNWRELLVSNFLSGSHQTLQCLEAANQPLTSGVKQINLWFTARKTSMVPRASNMLSLQLLCLTYFYILSLYTVYA